MLSIDLEFTASDLPPNGKDSFVRIFEPRIEPSIFCLKVQNGIMKIEPWHDDSFDLDGNCSDCQKGTTQDVLQALSAPQIQRALVSKLGEANARIFLDAANEKAKRCGLDPIRPILISEHTASGQAASGSVQVLRLRR